MFVPGLKQAFLALLLLIIALLTALFSGPTYGDNHPDNLIVGVKESAPFVVNEGFENRQLSFSGTDIDRIEAMHDGTITYKAYPTVTALLKAVEDKEVDIAVGAISITAERETRVDFLLPYMFTGLSYLSQANDSIIDLMFAVLPTLLKGIGVIIVVNLFAGLIFTLIEFRHNDAIDLSWKSIFVGFYWSTATLTTVGYGDWVAKTALGKIFSTVWMWTGLIITGMMTGLVVAAISLESADNEGFNVFEDRIAVVEGSTGEAYARKLGKSRNIHTYTTLEEAVESVTKNDTDAVIHDKVLLESLAHQHEGVIVSERLLTQEYYAFAVAQGVSFKEELNRRLLVTLED